ncbi:hypothetical protein K469DRAFT_69023 [Zopfia rhizophila CBS 207.26]|uniref:Uncharacterized protein n=1 Tax=Zopfia rhizophila CBS 207.26 TaxID=1314779 RepID=A0A6A6DBI8_9PEZI|nr:hypothetical protein K469DRAFT_69023 [Zopfia rhizophila CBS 207.26]
MWGLPPKTQTSPLPLLIAISFAQHLKHLMAENEEQKAVRILAIVTRKSTYWHSAWTSTEDIVSTAVTNLRGSHFLQSSKDDLPIQLLAMHKWPHTIHIVFDIFNDSYDVTLAHLPEHNNLPIVSVHFGQRIKVARTSASLSNRVNTEIALAHNLNGQHGVPPFREDHTRDTPPLYLNPRDPSLIAISSGDPSHRF